MDTGCWCLIAGGGTAGHVVPALSVAEELVRRGVAHDRIRLVVSERPIDAQILDGSPFSSVALPGRGLERRLTVRNLVAAWGLIGAFFRSLALMGRARPAVVLAVGGYASVACATAALLLRVPLVVAEQNARAGAANRLVSRWARACAVSFPDTDLPRAVVTGNPVRGDVLEVDRTRDRVRDRTDLGVAPGRMLILAFAGSLGARRLNDAMLDLADIWRDRADLAIRHVVGSRDWDSVQDRIGSLADAALAYQALRYEDHMSIALGAADVAVCRAGGTTVAELSVVGLPAVFVPLPIAPRDHQTANAQALVAAGAARLIADADLTGARLARELEPILSDGTRLAEMAVAAQNLGRPHAAARVADLLEEHARGR